MYRSRYPGARICIYVYFVSCVKSSGYVMVIIIAKYNGARLLEWIKKISSIENGSAQNIAFPKTSDNFTNIKSEIDKMFNKLKVFSFSEMFYELNSKLEASEKYCSRACRTVATALIVHIDYRLESKNF